MNRADAHPTSTMGPDTEVCRAALATPPALIETYEEVPMGVEPTPDAPVRKLSRRLRFEILRRDDHTCRYCGGRAPDVALTVDHVIPVALGGTDEPSNLATACRDCNAGKTSTAPDQAVVEQVNADAEKWAAAMRLAAEIERENRDPVDDDLMAAFRAEWCQVMRYADLPTDWRGSLETFMRAGLTEDDLIYALRRCAAKQADFRYFAGICWSLIRRREQIAMQMLNEDG